MYAADYDEKFFPTNHQPGTSTPDPTTDQNWVQILQPYARDFGVFKCPKDWTHAHANDPLFDPDLGTGDVATRFYNSTLRSNLGYNYFYLAPVVRINGQWVSSTRSLGQVSDPANTLVLADSAFEVKRGVPSGGGNYLIIPPCRYEVRNGRTVDSFAQSFQEVEFFAEDEGWDGINRNLREYGHVWPWHEGKATTLRVDGSTSLDSIKQLTEGCDAKASWRGNIFDNSKYQWDLK